MSRPIFSLTARVAIVGALAPGTVLQLRQPPEEPPGTAREAAQVPPTPDHCHGAACEGDVQILDELERATRRGANEQALLALANPQLAFDGMMQGLDVGAPPAQLHVAEVAAQPNNVDTPALAVVRPVFFHARQSHRRRGVSQGALLSKPCQHGALDKRLRHGASGVRTMYVSLRANRAAHNVVTRKPRSACQHGTRARISNATVH